MDGALPSSRHGNADRAGGPPRHHHHNRNDRHDHRHGRRGGGKGGGYHNRRHQPYRRDERRGGSRPPRSPGNRFGGASTTSVDPQMAMLRQLGAMLGRVGELQAPPEGSTVVESITKNIADLAQVLCSEANAPQFLKFQTAAGPPVRSDVDMESDTAATPVTTVKAEEEAGTLAHLVISTVSTLPLQTPSYAGLTLAVNELAPKPQFSGFASRCVIYAMRQFSQDLDSLLLGGLSVEDRSRVTGRMDHLLRYLALLGRLRIVLGYDEDDKTAATSTQGLTLAGCLHMLTTASVKAATSLQQLPTAFLLAHLVLSTLPYVQSTIPKEFVLEQILEPLETNVLNPETYKSTFAPGVGSTALLLKEEQQEEIDDDEEEEEEEDEDDEEDASGQRCDTLQDLLRSVRRLMQNDDKATEFSLLVDAPWAGLKAAPASQPIDSEGGEAPPQETLEYKDEPIRLSLTQGCRSIPFLLSDNDDGSVQLQCFGLGGVVFGRLPIFGSPPEDVDDDEEDEEDMETPKNEQLQAYQKGYGLLDRYFLANAVRDCLLSHQSHVSDTGLERGSAKDVAQQLWAISYVFPQKGVEYGIIEAMLSLIMQSNNEGAFRSMFVSRVLLELTRLQPSVMPQALALAVANIVSYYLPALVPSARDNFSCWFAFHLINTDYQWPAGYWEQWASYVANGKRNSRGDFVQRTLTLMESQLSAVQTLVTDCLPPGSALASCLMVDESVSETDESEIIAIGRDLEIRIWEKNEDPDSLMAYLIGDEVSETVAGGSMGEHSWWRTGLAIRSLLQPATREQAHQRQAIQRAQNPAEDDAMEEEEEDTNPEDVLTSLTENIIRYRPMLLATFSRDAQAIDESKDIKGEAKVAEGDLLALGESVLLKELQIGLGNARVLLEGCITCLLDINVVSGLAVMRWALGDYDGKGTADIVLRWWEFATIALRMGIANALAGLDSSNDDNGESGGMIIDRGGDDEAQSSTECVATQRMNAILKHIDPILQYTTKRVCHLLQQSDNTKKRLTPYEVDLVEGLKTLINVTKSLVLSNVKGDNAASTKFSEKEAQELWSQSSGCSPQLASVCIAQGGNSLALETLIASLQSM